MKMNADKNLEEFVDKIMKETSLENPAPGFTTKVMAEVLATKINNATDYKPLISKRGWFIIFATLVLIVCIIMYSNEPASGWFQNFDFTVTQNNIIKNLSAIKLSSVTLYAVVLLTLMLLVQLTLLKNYFNKRMER